MTGARASKSAAPEPLVDTDVWIDFLRGNAQAIAFIKKLPERIWISAISVAELHAGVREGAERLALDQLLSTLDIASLDAQTASEGGLLRRDWGRSHGVGLNDALIAATAKKHGLRLWTLNLKHYPMLEKNLCKQAYAKT